MAYTGSRWEGNIDGTGWKVSDKAKLALRGFLRPGHQPNTDMALRMISSF